MSLIVVVCILFGIGLFGVMARRDVVAILASIEVMMGSALVMLVALAPAADLPGAIARGQAVGVLVLVVAAAEAAVGLALIVAVARRFRVTRIDEMTERRG